MKKRRTVISSDRKLFRKREETDGFLALHVKVQRSGMQEEKSITWKINKKHMMDRKKETCNTNDRETINPTNTFTL